MVKLRLISTWMTNNKTKILYLGLVIFFLAISAGMMTVGLAVGGGGPVPGGGP